ncbi:Uncharacterized protein NEOC65_002380 [Neochlamydia sp. AcF65]|uniref:leucine-rich repeat domain-containing protein n=1 Tax=Neochlamydia sp. AcF65 TaxID=2795735 RepID=UPI001BC93FA3|nr:leucine-rich repeat domain-containing protein [Neochlamydia sp. AcF65]MBS4167274.1 Uncharacterized protein [Neochlamydia sp. AcF65]
MMAPTSTSSIQAKFHPTILANIEDPVSGELLARAVTLFPCGHTFNEDTVIQCLARNKLCPLDRRLIERHAPNYIVRQLAETAESYPLKSLKESYIDLLLHLLEKPQIQEVLTLKEILENQVEELMGQNNEELTNKEKISYKWMEKLLGENEKVRQFVVEKLRQIHQSSAPLLSVAPQPSISATSLYKAIVHVHFPDEYRDFIEQAHMLDKIYKIESNLSAEEKVAHIFQQIFNLATSLSPLEFEEDSKESKNFTLNNYSSYLLNINRLLLWQKLPGGKKYLSQPQVKALPLKKKSDLLAKWLDKHSADLSCLELNLLKLTALPPEIKQLSMLSFLDLRDNQLTALPAAIGQLSQLRQLWLGSNQLTALPATIGQLSQLKVLWLDNNQLTALPVTIGQLPQLKVLWLDNNQLTALPATIGGLSNLAQLSLNNNRLTALPAAIRKLSQLKVLWLDNNQLTALPTTIGQLSNLAQLSLNNNQLTALPATIWQLSNLQDFYLSNNPQLSFLYSYCFLILKILRKLL